LLEPPPLVRVATGRLPEPLEPEPLEEPDVAPELLVATGALAGEPLPADEPEVVCEPLVRVATGLPLEPAEVPEA
jgi:hypothetical protein